ncbi:hypothetical protein NKG05_01510 [Oerskovia sp. M15]
MSTRPDTRTPHELHRTDRPPVPRRQSARGPGRPRPVVRRGRTRGAASATHGPTTRPARAVPSPSSGSSHATSTRSGPDAGPPRTSPGRPPCAEPAPGRDDVFRAPQSRRGAIP